VILRPASRGVAISILILLLLIANHHLNSQSKEITYSYVVILSPNGTPAKSEEFINSLSSLGISANSSYIFQKIGVGATINLTSSQAALIERLYNPFIMFKSSAIYISQASDNQQFNRTWSYFPGGLYNGKNVTVAIIDTGIDYNIPALSGKVIGGYNLVDNNNNITDTDGHGTEVASIIAANSTSFMGVAPGVKILAYKIFSLNETTSALVVEAMDRAAKDGAKIINLSLGGALDENTLWKLGYMLQQQGIALVAAAGNDGPSLHTLSSPGDLPTYFSVGASTSNYTSTPIALLRVNGNTWLESVLPMLSSPLTRGIINASYVFVGSATPQDVKNLDLKGKIAISLRDRKTTFTQMDYDVARAGAIALVVINDVNSSLQGVILNNITSEVPAVAISLSDGQKLDLLQGNNSYIQLQIFIPNSTYPAFFSSRGPAGFFSMKPEIMAEGDLVPALSPYGSYLVSGTSFSTPQVTGAIALLMQEHPSLLPVQYYSMLTLSAEKMYRWNESYPSYVEGAGEINITKALNMQFALERQDYEMIYPSSNGYYNDTIAFTFFMPGLNYSLSYQGIFPARLNQTYISSNHPYVSISVSMLKNIPSQAIYDESLIIKGGSESYSLPIVAIPNNIGIYFNYTDLALYAYPNGWHQAFGNITLPDGTIYSITLFENAGSQLPLPNLISGFYYASVVFKGENQTSYLSFYIPPSLRINSQVSYYPISALVDVSAYAIFLVGIASLLILYNTSKKSFRREP